MGLDRTDLRPHLLFGPDAPLAEALAAFEAGAFSEGMGAAGGLPSMDRTVWAGVRLLNATRDDGREPDRFALALTLLMPRAAEVYVIRRGGLAENVLSHSRASPYEPAQHAAARLRSAAFGIAPQESVVLLMRIRFASVESIGAELVSPQALTDTAIRSGATLAIFYAISLASLVFLAGGFIALGMPVFLAFTGVFSIGLLVNLDGDGLLFRLLFPDRPDLRDPVHAALIWGLGFAGLVTAGLSAAPGGRHTALSRSILALTALAPVGFAVSLGDPGPIPRLAGYLYVCATFVASYLASRVWKQVEGSVHTVAMVLIGAHAAAFALLIVGVLAGVLPAWLSVADAVRSLYAGILLSSSATLAVHIVGMRAARQAAAEGRLAALAEEAERSRELLEAERNYARAKELAALRQRQLATATHDLKQPLASLRLSLDAASAGAPAELRERIARAVDYMEALSDETIRSAEEGAQDAALPPAPREGGEAAEPYELSVVIGTVHRMFEEEAVSKGLTLRAQGSSALVEVPPLALMRVVSNLAANAIRYTERGRVLIGVRRGGGLRILVADTGPGMDAAAQTALRAPRARGAASTGHGLGLAVCDDLCARHGMRLDLCSEPGRGTLFTLHLPAPGGP